MNHRVIVCDKGFTLSLAPAAVPYHRFTFYVKACIGLIVNRVVTVPPSGILPEALGRRAKFSLSVRPVRAEAVTKGSAPAIPTRHKTNNNARNRFLRAFIMMFPFSSVI